jgi:translation initiation factor IF-3
MIRRSEGAFKDKTRVNDRIRVPEVRVVDENGEQRGVMTPQEAIVLAEAAGLDLVEVAPTAKPPVCRVMDYSKHKYDQAKKAKEARKKQKVIHIKEIKLHPRIDTHDYDFKRNHIEKFIKRGDKVKVTMVFRGRENQHVETGRAVVDKLVGELSAIAEVEKAPVKEGRQMVLILMPR